MGEEHSLSRALDQAAEAIHTSAQAYHPSPQGTEVGRITSVGQGVVWGRGLDRVQSEELVVLGEHDTGMVLDLLPDRLGIVLLSKGGGLRAGDEITRTGHVLDVPVGGALLGRVLDPLGNPLDGNGPVQEAERLPVQREAPAIIQRAPVEVPLQTGLKVVDTLFPIGRGQRELVLGDRQTGKTALAVDTIINQKGKDVVCVYCAVAQRSSNTAKVLRDLRKAQAMDYTVVVVVEGDDPPGLQYVAPYAATTMAEHFMAEGRDVLIVYDDLSKHAIAYRELSLLLRRPPGREAFPGDIFHLHSKLLERSTRLRPSLGGGSLTSLPIAETQAQNLSAYIPTNLISITDGQISLSPELFRKGILPAVDVSTSVSRVGGKTQYPAFRTVAGDLRLAYSQFVELESFSRFSTRLDEDTRNKLERGRRVREVLKQPRFATLGAAEQIAALVAVNAGVFDKVEPDKVRELEAEVRKAARKENPDICDRVEQGEPLADEDVEALKATARKTAQHIQQETQAHGDH